MQLFSICKLCKEEIIIKSNASTRPELRSEKGEDINVNCDK